MSLVQVNYRVPPELREAIKDRAAELGVDASEFVRQGLQAALTLERGLFEPTGRTRRGKAVRVPGNGAAGVSERPAGSGSLDGGSVPGGAGRSEAPVVDLALVLASRTGMPRALMERRLRDGRVSVNGEVVREERWPLSRTDVLALDGEAV